MGDSNPTKKNDDYLGGSVSAFRLNWQGRSETRRYHFQRGAPSNQIQFAFQSHWRVFQKVMGDVRSGRAIEVGCGRGSMGAFFSDNGFEVHLLDTSPTALESARNNFTADGLDGMPVVGDTLALPYANNSFDVLVSIGLLEHFKNVSQPVLEQLRILRPGGVFLGYVVPERPISIQTLAIPANLTLRVIYETWTLLTQRNSDHSGSIVKAPLYRNAYWAKHYLAILKRAGVQDMGSFGMFPVPLVSHSPRFPFSLMHPVMERSLVRFWKILLGLRPSSNDPWICPEWWGLAFLVWAKK